MRHPFVFSLNFLVYGKGLDDTALHRTFVREKADARPISAVDVTGERGAILDDAAHELVHKVGVRATVTAALLEGKVGVALVINASLCKSADLWRQQMRVIGGFEVLGQDRCAAL